MAKTKIDPINLVPHSVSYKLKHIYENSTGAKFLKQSKKIYDIFMPGFIWMFNYYCSYRYFYKYKITTTYFSYKTSISFIIVLIIKKHWDESLKKN